MHADVLIIGAGPSGGAAGLRLAQAGLSVVCLEQGEWPDRRLYRGGELDWELTALKQWSYDPNVRAAPSDYPIDLSDSEARVANFNAVGGGTDLFSACWPRLTPNNFRSRSVAGYGEDWPIDYAELQPYYERTDREVGVSGLGGNPAYPPGADPPLPPLPIRDGGLLLARAHARMQRHWWPASNAILSAPYDGRNPCVARDTCMTGCGEGAKGSADLAYWRHVRELGGRVITRARVTRIVLDRQGRAAGAEWFDRDGHGHLQTADVVLCGANGLGTPRLLLASADNRFRDGLANGSGLVGRNLMFHHYGCAVGVFDDCLATWYGQATWIVSHAFYDSDPSHGAPGTSMWAMGNGGTAGGPLMYTLGLGDDAWGVGHHQAVADGFGRTLSWSLCCEDTAQDSNYMELSSTQTDASGLPIPVVHYRVPDQAKQLAAWQEARCSESLQEAGAKFVITPDIPTVTGHLMGTARMGDDRDRSVVDRYGMSHEIPNLGIVDGSVFVTSGGVNPTSTICALASRTADYLLKHRAAIPRASLATSYSVAPRFIRPAAEQTDVEPVSLSADEQERLAQFAELLIPSVDWRPSTRAVRVGGALAAAVLKARPDLGAPLRRALSVPGEAASVLDELRHTDAEARTAVELLVAGGYYMSPEVWSAIGYPGQLARPSRPEDFPRYIDEGLLDHLLPVS